MSFWMLYYHLVWGMKNREHIITEEREALIRQSIRASCEQHKVLIHGIGMMPDHLHLAVSIPPTCTIADIVRYFKGSSTHLINKSRESRVVDTFGWQREYGALSFGERSLNEIVAYVENQKQHHADDKLWSLFEQLERPYTPTS